MKSAVNSIRKLRPATIIAILALFVAVGGTATAASGLINGKKLKNNTVTGKKLKNKTVTKNKLAPATIKALKGNQGPQGPKGEKGEKGEKGNPGENGVVSPNYTEFNSTNIGDGVELAIGTVNVPAGRYMITGAVDGFTLGSGRVECNVSTNSGGGSSPSVLETTSGANQRVALPINYVTTTNTVTSVTLGCRIDDTSGSASGALTVVPVQ